MRKPSYLTHKVEQARPALEICELLDTRVVEICFALQAWAVMNVACTRCPLDPYQQHQPHVRVGMGQREERNSELGKLDNLIGYLVLERISFASPLNR